MRMGYKSWALCREPLRGHIRFGGSTQCRPCYKERGVSGRCRVRVPGCSKDSTNVRERGKGRGGFAGGDEGKRVRDPRLDDEPLKISGPPCGQIGMGQ
jgi:hypothetical protein